MGKFLLYIILILISFVSCNNYHSSQVELNKLIVKNKSHCFCVYQDDGRYYLYVDHYDQEEVYEMFDFYSELRTFIDTVKTYGKPIRSVCFIKSIIGINLVAKEVNDRELEQHSLIVSFYFKPNTYQILWVTIYPALKFPINLGDTGISLK